VSGFFDNKDNFEIAWHCYRNTMKSDSDKPAVIYRLYKRAIMETNARFKMFTANENLEQCGRRYNPPLIQNGHSLLLNYIWIMAQLHKGRAFYIYSPLVPKNFKRRSKGKNERSAFAVEVSAAHIKAKYSLYLNEGELYLCPDKLTDITQLNLPRLLVSEEDVVQAENTLSFYYNEHDLAKKMVSKIDNFVLKVTGLAHFEDAKNVLKNMHTHINNIFEEAVSNSKDTDLLLKTFIEYFNAPIIIPDPIKLLSVGTSAEIISYVIQKIQEGILTIITSFYEEKRAEQAELPNYNNNNKSTHVSKPSSPPKRRMSKLFHEEPSSDSNPKETSPLKKHAFLFHSKRVASSDDDHSYQTHKKRRQNSQ